MQAATAHSSRIERTRCYTAPPLERPDGNTTEYNKTVTERSRC
jgi:hypothetical protein